MENHKGDLIMHKAGDLATQAGRAVRSTESLPTLEHEPKRALPDTAMDLIGATMTAAFGHRWTSVHGDDFTNTSGRIWAIELAGMGQRSIQRGLELAIKEVWPPVLSDFKSMCQGVIPITSVELQRAGDPADQHPFTVLVGRFISYTEWKAGSPERQDKMLAKAYEMAKAHLVAGGKMPSYTPASQQLTAEDQRPAPPPIMMTAADAILECRRALRMPDPNAETEPTPEPPESKPAEVCIRCKGTRKEAKPAAWHPKQRGDECVACYGSGLESAYNRIVHDDGTTEERLP